MYIKAKVKESQEVTYLNTDRYDRFIILKDQVEGVGIDNYSIFLEKTPELKEQLDSLLIPKTSKGFEKFN